LGLVGAFAGALVGSFAGFLVAVALHRVLDPGACVAAGFLFGTVAGRTWAARLGGPAEGPAEPPMSVELEYWDSLSQPMPAPRVELPFGRSFTDAEAERLRRGLIPQTMEDKWFGVLHPGALDFYRSWTGLHIYSLPVREGPGGIEVGPLIVNDDPAQYRRRGDHFDLEMAHRLIGRMLEPPPASRKIETTRAESVSEQNPYVAPNADVAPRAGGRSSPASRKPRIWRSCLFTGLCMVAGLVWGYNYGWQQFDAQVERLAQREDAIDLLPVAVPFWSFVGLFLGLCVAVGTWSAWVFWRYRRQLGLVRKQE
jgi:hypothetical protein